MSDWLDVFQKQGGIDLLKRYYRGGALTTALAEFILLGKSTKALEILRSAADFKISRRIGKIYADELEKFDLERNSSIKSEASKKVWFCWFQGIENAPDIVRICYKSIIENLPEDRELIIITNENIRDYVQFPPYIQKKIDNGIIKGAHLSDLIRLELLTRYGGSWIDSTVYCTSKSIPDYMLNSKLFMFQILKPGKDAHSCTVSNWFISAYSHNKILEATLFLLYSYWKKNDTLVDYYIFHIFFQMVIEKYSDEWHQVIPVSNSTSHILLLRLFEEYEENMWENIICQCPFHKLTYKIKEEDARKGNTNYKKILELLRTN